MKSATTSAAMALLLASTQHQSRCSVRGFAPPRPSFQTTTRAASTPSVFPHRMVMDRPDPLNIVDAEIVSVDRHQHGGGGSILKKKAASTDPTPFFVDLFQKFIGGEETNNSINSNMKFMAAALAMALVFMPLPSEAAMSGGRMGGSYSRPAQSRSMPSRSSGGYSRGYSSGYGYSRPSSVIVAPRVGFGYSPFMTPFSPFGGYGYGGGVGAISYSRGPSFFDFLFLGGLFFAASSFLRNAGSGVASSSPFDGFGGSSVSSALGSGTSVVQLSVALEVPNRDDPNSVLSVLDRLSRTSKTDSRVGIQNLTSQVALELLRRRSSIVSASSSYQHYQDSTKAGRDYEAKAIRERSKFERETVSKYGGVDYSSGKSTSSSLAVDGKATMAVVTLVLAIDGDSTKISKSINSVSDVEEALRRIASDAKVDDCLQSVEILWTPEDRGETLSLRDVVADYPELRSI